MEEFWGRALRTPGSGTLSMGAALRWTKHYWDGHWSVDAAEEKTGAEFTLFGVPWVTAPYRGGTSPSVQDMAGVAPPGLPVALGGGIYVVTATFDASGYSVLDVDGFDLVEVPGMEFSRDTGVPMIPIAETELLLPLDGSVLSAEVITSGVPINLGTLNIPMVEPGVPIPGGDPGGPREAPGSLGIYPPVPVVTRTVDIEGHKLFRAYASPLSYDSASDQATLVTDLALRITYQLSSTTALVDMSVPADLPPNEPFVTSLWLTNASAEPVELNGTLILEDATGTEVAATGVGPIVIQPGEVPELMELEWATPADEGPYSLFVYLWESELLQIVGHRTLGVSAIQLGELAVPAALSPGERADFALPVTNRRSVAFGGEATLSIYTAAGIPVATLEVPVSAPGSGQQPIEWAWDTSGMPAGSYIAAASVREEGEGTLYGVVQRSFTLEHRVFLPLVLREE